MSDAITVHCPSCETAFPVDPAKVPPGGVRARCSACQDIFPVEAPAEDDPAFSDAGLGGDQAVAEEEPETALGEPEPGGSEEMETGGFEEQGTGGFEEEDDLELETTEDFVSGGEGSGTAVEEPSTEPPEEAPAAGPELEEAPGATTAPEVEEEAEDEAPSRPAFGQRTPEQKAQRLARVLVSDMISYNPELHQKALERDTLKDDFEEEIEKSWEEYVEQVGEEMASSTSFWTEALNEILAEGREVFDESDPAGGGQEA